MRAAILAITVLLALGCGKGTNHSDAGPASASGFDASAATGAARDASGAGSGGVAGSSGKRSAAGDSGGSSSAGSHGAAASGAGTSGAGTYAAGIGAGTGAAGTGAAASGGRSAGGSGGRTGNGGSADSGGAGSSGMGGGSGSPMNMDMDAGPKTPTCVGQTPYTGAFVADPKLCVYVYAQNLGSPRQMAFAPNGDLFINNGQVVVLWDANGNGTSDSAERATFATASGIAHGLAFSRDAAFVYASSPTTVYRWPYTNGKRSGAGAGEVVLNNIPGGGHSSRTLAFDSQGRLIVSIGSASNVDSTQEQWDTRALVRRFTLPATIPSGGIDFASGVVIASGMRNEAGLYVDAQDRIWGVENGRDDLSNAALGGDIHTDNPGEEINLIDGQGTTFYGYPFCFSEFVLAAGSGAATQWADDSIAMASRKTDGWCRSAANVRPPAFSMQAHWAPLGIIQYTGSTLPFGGDFIITAHGSWNRSPATGRLLARAHVTNGAITAVTPIVGAKSSGGQLEQGMWDARPVDVRQGADEALYFSDDAGGRVFKVGYSD
jgi:glucose/arabinose dehydrogenase